MQVSATFAEVLDETLRGFQPPADVSDRQQRFRTAPLHPFLFNRIDCPALRTRIAGAASVLAPAPIETVPVRRAPARPARRLTAAQQRSLDAFVQFGARITQDFSGPELRSAFRGLARRYHPDRHPHASDSDKAALSRQFTAIASSYETLATALDAAAVR